MTPERDRERAFAERMRPAFLRNRNLMLCLFIAVVVASLVSRYMTLPVDVPGWVVGGVMIGSLIVVSAITAQLWIWDRQFGTTDQT